jgi:outer membrane protein OmpA-like peptidoglycan-associated protein
VLRLISTISIVGLSVPEEETLMAICTVSTVFIISYLRDMSSRIFQPAWVALPSIMKGMKMILTRFSVSAADSSITCQIDKAEIRNKYYSHLKKVAEFLKKYPDTDAVIEGHTDSEGPYEYNLMLSQKRANSVRKYLIDQFDVPHWRLDAKGYGESRPIADNSTSAGRQSNRRVTAVISSSEKK